jgi:hypothetical protein
VWQKIKKAMISEGLHCVKHKWVFDIKHIGFFQLVLLPVDTLKLQVLNLQKLSAM